MYTTPATTVGLASRIGAGSPAMTGGCQCHTWVADAAFDGVNAVALLIEACWGSCRYCGQSRPGPAARGAPATAAPGTCTAPVSPTAAVSNSTRMGEPSRPIAAPSGTNMPISSQIILHDGPQAVLPLPRPAVCDAAVMKTASSAKNVIVVGRDRKSTRLNSSHSQISY